MERPWIKKLLKEQGAKAYEVYEDPRQRYHILNATSIGEIYDKVWLNDNIFNCIFNVRRYKRTSRISALTSLGIGITASTPMAFVGPVLHAPMIAGVIATLMFLFLQNGIHMTTRLANIDNEILADLFKGTPPNISISYVNNEIIMTAPDERKFRIDFNKRLEFNCIEIAPEELSITSKLKASKTTFTSKQNESKINDPSTEKE